MKLALSILCENSSRRTGLTTLFHEFVSRALELCPDVDWIVYAGPRQEWALDSPRVRVVRDFPANDQLGRRLLADHFLVPAAAKKLGADALVTIGFVPLRKTLPVAMHLLALHHLDRTNRSGFARSVYRRLIVDRSVRRADKIITNSEFAASQIRAAYPNVGKRIVISPEGLQHEIFHPDAGAGEADALREKFSLAPGYLLWTSNFYPYKQAPLLLDSYARLAPALRARHPLVMAGGSWGGADAIRAQASALGIAGDLRILGWVDDADLAPLYRQARAFVLASREETFGRSVIEAMACGTPCIVNDIAIMHEVTGGHAVIVDFQQTAAAAAALDAILGDDALRARLRADGLPWTQRFSFARLVTERVEAIRAMLSSASVAGR